MLTTAPSSARNTTTRRITHPNVLWTGVVAGAVAAVATTVVAAIAKGVDVPVTIEHQPIPVAGFASLTFVCALLGTGIAAVVGRRSHRARAWFIRVAVALTVLSFVPDLTADTDTATRVTLITTHIVAALVVIPALSRRLTTTGDVNNN